MMIVFCQVCCYALTVGCATKIDVLFLIRSLIGVIMGVLAMMSSNDDDPYL